MKLRPPELPPSHDSRQRAAVVGAREGVFGYWSCVAVDEIHIGLASRSPSSSAIFAAAPRAGSNPCAAPGARGGREVAAPCRGGVPGTGSHLPRKRRKSSCIPRQIPSTGWVSVRRTFVRPAARNRPMASAAAPTPGSTTRSALAMVAPSALTCVRAPRRSRANWSEARFAPLSTMTASLTAAPWCSVAPCLRGESRLAVPDRRL